MKYNVSSDRIFQSEYSRFSDTIWQWNDIEHFISESQLRDGIHQIGLNDGRYFDLLFRGLNNRKTDLPIFFNGAVMRDGTCPPYFSGSNVAVATASPVVAVADPTLNLSPDLGIGWYSGGIGSDFDNGLLRILKYLKSSMNAELVMVGGSAGGFAALKYASQLQESALVWNPQIDLLRYNADHVSKFLATRFARPEWNNTPSEIRDSTGAIRHSVAEEALLSTGSRNRIETLSGLKRLLYLQNKSDNHARIHAAPIRERSGFEKFSDGFHIFEDKTMLVADFNVGHRAPSREIIVHALNSLINNRVRTLSIAQDILAKYNITI